MNQTTDPLASSAIAEKVFRVNFNEAQIARFWSKVSISGEDDCWIWTGAVSNHRYGSVRNGYQNVRVHRVSFFLSNGEFPDSKMICHKCDVPLCVNPKHLFLGTNTDNVRDMIHKVRDYYKTEMSLEKAHEIRMLYFEGGTTMRELSEKFGISVGMICMVIHKKFWN